MDPATLPPSAWLFRGAAALLVVCLGLAAWHLVAWPQFPNPPALALAPLPSRGGDAGFPAVATATQAATPSPAATPTAGGAAPTTTTPAATASPAPATTTPPPAATATLTPTTAPTATPTRAAGAGRRYTIEPGDTLLGIAFEFGVTLEALLQANDITPDSLLTVGKELVIP